MVFCHRVYLLTSMIPEGGVSTYGLVAKVLDSSPRAVGQALSRNPDLVEVPCHRVVSSGGGLGGYIAGAEEKRRLLESEGVLVRDNRIVDFEKKLYTDFGKKRG
ncbi:MAG: MGMT family protein [Candidatus Altiarchaeota archaeon]|nr:MGMT family protein [Candidatus Altiarchaeota archaeon]